MEVWKNVSNKFYADVYQVSDKGNIKRTSTTLILKTTLREGYPSVCLCKNNIKQTFHVHRLVAESFIDNPLQLPFVNHKDGDKLNNSTINLEWVTVKDNVHHALQNNLAGSCAIKVRQLSLDGIFIKEFDSILLAAKSTNSSDRHISSVCKGKRLSHNGFIWKYVDKTLDAKPLIYKDIPGYKNYLITPEGKIYNTKYGQFMSPHKHANGYLSIGLSNTGKKEFYIHQLVAQNFIPNPDNKKYVNHKNLCKDDNKKDNLEWVSASENMRHANESLNFAHKKKVIQYDLNNNIIGTYNSVKDAAKINNTDNSSIVKSCKGKMKSAGGYIWKYMD